MSQIAYNLNLKPLDSSLNHLPRHLSKSSQRSLKSSNILYSENLITQNENEFKILFHK